MTKEKLKQTARTLFLQNGYEGTSISEIVKSVGIKKASFYSHFESKEALLKELLHEVIHLEHERIQQFLSYSSGNSLSKLKGLFEHISGHVEDEAELFLYRLYLFPPVEVGDNLKVLVAEVEKQINHIVLQLLNDIENEHGLLKKSGDRERFMSLFYCLYDGLRMEKRIYSGEEFEVRKMLVSSILIDFLTKEHL